MGTKKECIMAKKRIFGIITLMLGIVLVFSLAACSKQSKGGDTGGAAYAAGEADESAIPAQFQPGTQSSVAPAQEMEKLLADVQAGKISNEEYQQRLMEIMTKSGFGAVFEDMDMQDQKQDQEESEEDGETSGWPPASVFSQFGLSNIAQPAGGTSRYTYHGNLYVWISKPNANTFRNLGRNVEAALGTKVDIDDDGFGVVLDRTPAGSEAYELYVSGRLEDNVILFTLIYVSGL